MWGQQSLPDKMEAPTQGPRVAIGISQGKLSSKVYLKALEKKDQNKNWAQLVSSLWPLTACDMCLPARVITTTTVLSLTASWQRTIIAVGVNHQGSPGMVTKLILLNLLFLKTCFACGENQWPMMANQRKLNKEYDTLGGDPTLDSPTATIWPIRTV